jgi:uncharacterized protein YijF (DUF1287 family)
MSIVVVWLLGVAALLPDRGIFPELTARVPAAALLAVPAAPWLRIDPTSQVLTLYDGREPLKAYLLASGPISREGPLPLPAGDAAELARVAPTAPRIFGPPERAEDADGDGIVDRLDILYGAKKLLLNRARYVERYVRLVYPGGDVPRTEGVCTDTVIRALRNAGIDLQRLVHEDLRRAPHAYPMAERVDPSINHRRVRTLLPWFQRHFAEVALDRPYLPGEIVFFDTLPSRPGPDHLGVTSDVLGPHGLPLVINNWTVGTTDAEMDLLPAIPVTHRFQPPLR